MRVTTYSALLTGGTALTLAAATETDVISQDNAHPDLHGIDISQADSFLLVLKNTGSHAIETVTVYRSPLGTNFNDIGQNLGPVSAGSKIDIGDDSLMGSRMRVTCTSASGTTLEVEIRVTRLSLS